MNGPVLKCYKNPTIILELKEYSVILIRKIIGNYEGTYQLQKIYKYGGIKSCRQN